MALYPTLMETLLAKKIEMASQQGGAGPGGNRLFRTDSLDSTSSFGSMALGEDVCRCDDCLLGIVDLYTISPVEQALAKKKRISMGEDWYGGLKSFVIADMTPIVHKSGQMFKGVVHMNQMDIRNKSKFYCKFY
ncbi:uncharacterized protein DMENIID0001_102660 [Sergentomyia squamirostris]